MTVVVTGGTGHIGANLVRELLDRGESVRALVRSTGSRALAGLDVEQVVGDIRHRDSLAAAFDGADVVFHLAALISIVGDRDGQVHETNVVGAENAATAALECNVRRFVHMCSIHAFDMTPTGHSISEQTARCDESGRRTWAYDRSKAEGERRVRRLIDDGLDAVIVHPTGVIGPVDFAPSRMGRVFVNLRTRRLPGLVAGGFDFVDVRDVVSATIAAAELGRTGESYILSGSYQPIPELARLAENETGARPPRFVSPMWLARIGAPFMQTAARMSKFEPLYTSEGLAALRANPEIDNTKATDELGFAARPIEQSVADVYEWFTENPQVL